MTMYALCHVYALCHMSRSVALASDQWRAAKAVTEITNGINRLRATSTRLGRKPVFKHILKPLLLPFAKECLQKRPRTLVQEDNAPSHSSQYQQEVFDLWEISRLLWPLNSPDLNMIEPCWFWMKRQTTKKRLITSRE
jgi:transposase